MKKAKKARSNKNKIKIGLSQANFNTLKQQINKARNVTNKAPTSVTPLYKALAPIINCSAPQQVYPMTVAPVHLRRVKFQRSYTVSGNGDLFVCIPTSALTNVAYNSTYGYAVVVSTTLYNPTSSNNDLGEGVFADASIVNENGLNLEPQGISDTGFNNALITAAHYSISLSGVSNLNKKGRIYMAEDISSSIFRLSHSSQSNGSLNTLVNKYNIANIAKLKHFSAKDLVTSDFNYTYNFIPDYNYASAHNYVPQSIPPQLTTPTKQFILIAHGCDPGTVINIAYQFDIQIEPGIVDLNTYPVQYSKCFANPDMLVRAIESDTNAVFAKTSCNPIGFDVAMSRALGKHMETHVFSKDEMY